jgi:hypothetical protein
MIYSFIFAAVVVVFVVVIVVRLHTVTLTHLNPLNTELKPICHLLALLGAHHILHISRIRVTTTDS